jgi:hypothetical protein
MGDDLVEKIKLKVGMKAVNQVTGRYMNIAKEQEVATGDGIILSNKKEYKFIKRLDDTLILVAPS